MATVDGEFLTDTPHNLISQGRFEHKDSLLGANADEGTFWILFALPGFSKDGPSLQNLTMFRNGVDIICWDLSDQQVLSRSRCLSGYRGLTRSSANAKCGQCPLFAEKYVQTLHTVKRQVLIYHLFPMSRLA